jgi:hypothetical protein
MSLKFKCKYGRSVQFTAMRYVTAPEGKTKSRNNGGRTKKVAKDVSKRGIPALLLYFFFAVAF